MKDDDELWYNNMSSITLCFPTTNTGQAEGNKKDMSFSVPAVVCRPESKRISKPLSQSQVFLFLDQKDAKEQQRDAKRPQPNVSV